MPGVGGGPAQRLSVNRTALLVVDVQERLLPAMPAPVAMQTLRYSVLLIEAARRLGVPVVVTQQYPRGLGGTAAAVAAALHTLPPAQLHQFDKTDFSAVGTSEFAALWPRLQRDQWIVAGMETHVCVFQSVRDIHARGGQAWVAADAAASRTKANWRNGLDLMQRDGAIISNTESIVFDLLQRAGGETFKALSQLIK